MSPSHIFTKVIQVIYSWQDIQLLDSSRVHLAWWEEAAQMSLTLCWVEFMPCSFSQLGIPRHFSQSNSVCIYTEHENCALTLLNHIPPNASSSYWESCPHARLPLGCATTSGGEQLQYSPMMFFSINILFFYLTKIITVHTCSSDMA